MKILKNTANNNSFFGKASKTSKAKSSGNMKTISFKKSSLNITDTKKLKGGVLVVDILAF